MLTVRNFSFSLKKLSEAWCLPQRSILELYKDCRWLSPVMEMFLARKLKGTLAPTKDSPYDLVSPDGKRWEVRCMNGKVSFAPSNNTGSGRKFKKSDLMKKLNAIDGFIICDSTTFPKIRCYFVPAKVVKGWWASGELRADASIIRKKVLPLLT